MVGECNDAVITLRDTCEHISWWQGRPIICTKHYTDRKEERGIFMPDIMPAAVNVYEGHPGYYEIDTHFGSCPVRLVCIPIYHHGEFKALVVTAFYMAPGRNRRTWHKRMIRAKRHMANQQFHRASTTRSRNADEIAAAYEEIDEWKST